MKELNMTVSRNLSIVKDETSVLTRDSEDMLSEIANWKLAEAFQKFQKVVLEKILTGSSLADIFEFLCLQVEQIIPCSVCSIMMLDDQTHCLNVAAAPSAPSKLRDALNGLVPGENAGSCGTAVYTGEMVVVEDTMEDRRWQACQELAREFGIRACWSIPVFSVSNKPVGTFAISSLDKRRPTSFERSLLESIAYLMGLAIERQKSECTLKENEQRFRDLYDTAPLAYVTVSPGGFIQMVNSRMVELVGLLKEEFIGRHIDDLYAPTPDGKEKARYLNQQTQKGLSFQGEELQLQRADGTTVWVRVTMRVICDRQGRMIERRGIFENISKQKKTEARIRLLTFGMDNAAEAIFTINAHGEFVDVNQTACTKFGYARKQMLSMSLADVEQDYSHDQWADHWSRLKEQGHDQYESVYRTKGGQTFTVDVLMKYVVFEEKEYGFFFIRDITKQKHEAVELEKRERLLQLMLETGPGCIKRVAEDGTLLHVNSAGLNFAEYSREEDVLGLSVFDLVMPEHRMAFEQMHQRVIGGQPETLQFQIQGKQGTQRWMETHAVPFNNPSTSHVEHLALTHDITERKHTEKVLQHVVAGVAAGTGTKFFQGLVQHLAQALDFDYVCVGRLKRHKTKVQTLAVWAQGRQGENIEYPLKGAPCETVLKESFSYYLTGLQSKFPDDQLLVEMNVDSYVGIALVDADGQPIGLMAGMNTGPMQRIDHVREIFQICAARVSGELERLQVESALRDSERQVRDILDSSASVIYVKDLQGRYLMVNRQWESIFNQKREEVEGRSDVDLFPSEIAARFQENDRAVLEKKTPMTFEEVALHADGPHTYVSNKFPFLTQEGVPYALCGISTDITERKQAEEVLKEMNIALTHAMPGISALDREGRYVQVNSHYAHMLGCEPEDLIGTSWEPTVVPEDLPRVYAAYDEMCRTGKGEFEVRGVRRDGKVFYKHGLMVKGASTQGNTIGHHCFMRDITERKTREDLLAAIHQAESEFITSADAEKTFRTLLDKILSLTESEYGFIGEVLHAKDGEPYLKVHAITDIAWDEETRAQCDSMAPNLEFHNLRNLFGEVVVTGQPVIANDPLHDHRRGGLPQGHPPIRAFFGLPFYHGDRLVGMVGIANRPGGYDQALLEFLQPLVTTCGMLLNAYQSFTLRERAEQALKHSEQNLREALDVQTQISQDLHDHILQSLYAVGLIISAAKKPLFSNKAEKAQNYIELSIQQLNQAIVEIREFIESLKHQQSGDIDFSTKIKVLVHRVNLPQTIRFTESIDPEAVSRLRNDQKAHLLNIIREAVRNATQHAQATNGSIVLGLDAHRICLTVQDNGVGFDMENVSEKGHGLRNIQDRADKLGGMVNITSTQHGTAITVTMEVLNNEDIKGHISP